MPETAESSEHQKNSSLHYDCGMNKYREQNFVIALTSQKLIPLEHENVTDTGEYCLALGDPSVRDVGPV